MSCTPSFGSVTNFTTNPELWTVGHAVQTCLSLLLLCTIGLAWFHIMTFNVISGHAMQNSKMLACTSKTPETRPVRYLISVCHIKA